MLQLAVYSHIIYIYWYSHFQGTHKKCAQSKIIPLTAFVPDFKRLVNLETLLPQLCAKQLLLPDEIEDEFHPHLKRGERITSLLVVLSRKGQEGVDGVIETLSTEETHTGHKELADILKRGYCKFKVAIKSGQQRVV